MNPVLEQSLEKVKEFWGKFSVSQRFFMIGGLAFTIALGVVLTSWMLRPNFQTLYSKLSAEDANRVVTLLQANNTPYELADAGTTVKVPEGSVYDLRIKVAGEGNLVGQGIGFEIFDTVQMGQTDFVQRINYQRALQGEIARTMSEFPNVESARVHLVVPERSLFIEEQQPPSASVILRLIEPGKRMDKKEIDAMVNLLTMSIEGLESNNVSISDNNGKALFSPKEEGSVDGSQLDYRLRYEANLERRIQELLSPVLGAGKLIAKVSADLDYSQRTIRREIFDPESAVIRSEQRTEEQQTGRANLGAESADVNFRGDGLGNSLSSQDGNREERLTNYEINKEEQSIISQMGSVERLTVAVAVDGHYTRNAEGAWEYVARNEAEINQIKQLVANAVGLDLARGDTIEISNMPFGDSELPVEPNAVELLAEFARTMGTPLLVALLAFIFIMLVVRPTILALIRPKVEAGEMLEGLEGLPSAEEQIALYEAQEEEAREVAESARTSMMGTDDDEDYLLHSSASLDEIKARALQLAEHNMEQTIRLMRRMMKQDKVEA